MKNMWANQNDNKLPLPSHRGNWLWDIDIKTVNFMLKSGMNQEMFYCPSNQSMHKYMDHFWTFGQTEWDGKKLTGGSGDFIVSGYCYILDDKESKRPAIRNKENKTGPKKWLRIIHEKKSAEAWRV